MTKLGTPIGAAPKSATVSVGLVSVGVPSGLRSAGSSIGSSGCRCRRRCRRRRRRRRRRRPSPPPPAPPLPLPPPPPPVAAAGAGAAGRADRRRRGSDRRARSTVGRAGLGPASVLSSGPAQSASARSVRPSPSSSRRLEHSGRLPSGGQVLAAGEVDVDAGAPAVEQVAPGARRSDHHESTPVTASAIVTRRFRLIPKNPGGLPSPADPPSSATAIACSGAQETLLVRLMPCNDQRAWQPYPKPSDRCAAVGPLNPRQTIGKSRLSLKVSRGGTLPPRRTARSHGRRA